MMRSALMVLALTAVCNGILPEIVDSGISHILDERPEMDPVLVEVEQLPEDPQQKPEDAIPQETNNSTTADQDDELGNIIDQGCIADGDCVKGRYCYSGTQNSRCQPCKETDVSCSRDVECCGDQLCVWGQCTQNATKGEAGSTCRYQSDCSPDLCCALHEALRFAVCSAKPIERERCLDASNHLMELLSWDARGEGPRKHCPCAGDLHCQHLGRGSMCLKGEDSSEEDLTDSLYSEIDYIL